MFLQYYAETSVSINHCFLKFAGFLPKSFVILSTGFEDKDIKKRYLYVICLQKQAGF